MRIRTANKRRKDRQFWDRFDGMARVQNGSVQVDFMTRTMWRFVVIKRRGKEFILVGPARNVRVRPQLETPPGDDYYFEVSSVRPTLSAALLSSEIGSPADAPGPSSVSLS